MAKTKFLSKVLAVLMVLSMLCSTGVLADYDSGLTTTDGTTAVTGEITMTSTLLNNETAIWAADEVAEAKWIDIADGLTLELKGTTDATTGTITYVIAPVDTFAVDPFDVDLMADTAVAIGTADITDGAFEFTIEADASKLVKNTTYELRLAYSNTEIADVTDASALVYQRYIKTYDWADATTKATRVINKTGIGDITIDIEGNPIRTAAIASSSAYRDRAVTHIRTADLTDGALYGVVSTNTPADFAYAGETAADFEGTGGKASILYNIGSELRGGVLLAPTAGESEAYFPQAADKNSGANLNGNTIFRFKATNPGKVYLVTNASVTRKGWTAVAKSGDEDMPGGVVDAYENAARNYLYVASEVTSDMLTAAGVTTVNDYLAANTSHAVKTADAPGYYRGGSKAWSGIGDTFYDVNTAFINGAGILQLPTANLDEDGNWIMTDRPYSMIAANLYNYTDGRGYLTQRRNFTYTYELSFEAGEWVEIPYNSLNGTSADQQKVAAVVQFDIPKADLATATVTTNTVGSYSASTSTTAEAPAYELYKSATKYTNEVVTFADQSNLVVTVPVGTAYATATVTDVNGATADVVADFGYTVNSKAGSNYYTAQGGSDTATAIAEINGNEYTITFKWDDSRPYIYDLTSGQYWDRNSIQSGDLTAAMKVGGKAGHVIDGSSTSSFSYNGVPAPENDQYSVVLGLAGANSGMAHMTYTSFKLMSGNLPATKADGSDAFVSFVVSAEGTVYVKTPFNGKVWPEMDALVADETTGWYRPLQADGETYADISGYPVYAIDVVAGDRVNIPANAVTDDNMATWNANLLAAMAEDATTVNQWVKYDADETILTTEGEVTMAAAMTTAGITVNVVEGHWQCWTYTPATGVYAPQSTTSSGTVRPIAVTYGTLAVYADFVNLNANKLDSITYTTEVGFSGSDGSKNYANAVDGKSIYAGGFYKPVVVSEAAAASVDAEAKTFAITVPYGTEIVNVTATKGDGSTIAVDPVYMLNDNGAAKTVEIVVGEDTYTGTITWAAATNETIGLVGTTDVYDVKYQKRDLYETGVNGYNIVPTKLNLDGVDYVIDESKYVTTDAETGETTGEAPTQIAAGVYINWTQALNTNVTAKNNAASAAYGELARWKIASQTFTPWIAAGLIASEADLHNATLVNTGMQYNASAIGAATGTNAAMTEMYNFKVKSAGVVYVIPGSATFTNDGTWTNVTADTLIARRNGSSSSGYTDSVYVYDNALYVKSVEAGAEVAVPLTLSGDSQPIVIYDAGATFTPPATVLSSLSYTTALAVTSPKESIAANSRDGKSLHTGGFYQPTLVTEATAVEIAEDETTINVTVPYGTEIVNLAGVDSEDAAVAFDAINLINNNGAATVTTTVGEIVYTINVAWAAYDAEADTANNHVYDVKYRIKDLANTTYYNIVPTKLVLTENRIAPQTVTGYKDNAGATVAAAAGAWYKTADVAEKNSNLTVHNAGAQINRGRLTTIAFDGWVRKGLVTASGIPGAALADTVTDAEVDAIAYAAMNGATAFVANYTDYTDLSTAAGANAAMAEHLTFKVAQDSIVYVNTSSSDIGEGWTEFSAGKLYLHNQVNSAIYTQAEDGTYTTFANSYINLEYNAGTRAFYRYAQAGDTVAIKADTTNKNITPIVIVRPVDFSAVEAPALDTVTYTIGDGEAAAVEFADGETTATVEVPWGTTDAISAAATITGVGNVAVSDAITLSKDASTGAITVTVTPVVGGEPTVYTINFAWGAAPVVESVSYTTGSTLYRVATSKDVALDAIETQSITVPWGTANVTVSYKLEGADAVALDAVDLMANGSADVAVELPEETITLTFTWGAAPAGQYVTGLTKYPNSWRDRMFVAFGDVDNAYTAANAGYANAGTAFFSTVRVPESIAQKGNVAVIADAGANTGMVHMSLSSFPYMGKSYPATADDGSDAWMSFTVAKAGKLYAAAPQYDEVWEELEDLGWTEAPFTMTWGAGQRKLYQKDVAAGELVYMPGAQLMQREINAFNEGRTDYTYVQVTAEQADAIEAAAIEIHGAGYNTDAVAEGDWIAFYTEAYLAENPDTVNYAGAVLSKEDGKEIEINHYTRAYNTVLFAVADECVTAEAKAPKYTGASTLAADGSIELSADAALYAEKGGEITYAIKSGAEYATLDGTTLTAIESAYVAGAAVVIEITQTFEDGTTLTSEATIGLAPVDMTKYGFLTIAEATGDGYATVYDAEDNLVIEGVTEEEGGKRFNIGTVVTLKPVAADGAEFSYWARVEGDNVNVYSRDEELTIAVPYGITLKAVFKTTAEDDYTISFVGHQDAMLASFTLSSVTGETFTTPEAPDVFGYEFKHYRVSNWADTFAAGVEVSKELIKIDTNFVAVYEQVETMTYTLTVVNGTVDGATSAVVTYNKGVTVVADAAAEGEKFSHWVDGNGQILSYDAEYKFYMAAADRTVEAVYVAEDAEVNNVVPVLTMTVTAVDAAAANGPIYGLYAERRVPEQYTVVENGIVYGYAGNNYGLTDDSDFVTLDNYNGKSTSKYQNNNGQYTVRLQMTEARQGKSGSWYASTYLIYRDTDGTLKTMYSPKALVWEKEAVAE